jgi:ferric-dicitrate binding protein FerR (iron transport regulator)
MTTDPGDDIDSAKLARYLQGESSEGEAAAVQRWIAADPANAETAQAVKAAFDRVTDDALWRGIAAGMARQEAPARVLGIARANDPPRWNGWRVARLAASLAIIAGGGFSVWRSGWIAPAQQFREFASARGSRTTITLRDGTRLVLGPATRLRVPGDFGRFTRTVELDGEALLTVVHDARRPFAVRTARTTVRDVGTTFVVHAYADDPGDRVAVTEGEVAIADVMLRARDGASVDSTGRVTVQRGIDLARDLAWAHGGLVFQNTPLRDAVRELMRVYDVDVTIADSTLASKLITASFGSDPVDVVLGVVAFAVGGHYEHTGRSVVIRSGVAPAGRPGRAADSEMRFARAPRTR